MSSERCQASEVELTVKLVNDLKPLKVVIAKRFTFVIWWDSNHASIFAKLYKWKGVDPLHKNGFKFLVYFLLVFWHLCKILFYIIFVYKLFEVFNPRINKAIIIFVKNTHQKWCLENRWSTLWQALSNPRSQLQCSR